MRGKLNIEDFIGKKFGKLLIVRSFYGEKDEGKTYVWVKCDCGNEEATMLSLIKRGRKLSCGCLRYEKASDSVRVHGLSKHPLYKIWTGIKSRCLSPNKREYKWYGGRGIKVCDEWGNDFKSFYDWAINNGWRRGFEIDRIDNNEGYSPQNCRCITHKQNKNNTSKNIIIEYKGHRFTKTELAEHFGLTFQQLNRRIQLGWDLEKIKNTPVGSGYRNTQKIYHKGGLFTLKQLSLSYNIPIQLLKFRISKGIPIEEAIKYKKYERKGKRIICTTTGVKFNSLSEAARKIGVYPQTIWEICNGVIKNHRSGLSFRYLEDENGINYSFGHITAA